MATATRRKPPLKRTVRKRNPHPGAFPHIDPNYPVKPMIDAETGKSYTVISMQLQDGSFLATVAEDQTIKAEARSRKAAESAAADLYLDKLERKPAKRNRRYTQAELDKIEDEMDWRLAQRRRKHKGPLTVYDRSQYEK